MPTEPMPEAQLQEIEELARADAGEPIAPPCCTLSRRSYREVDS